MQNSITSRIQGRKREGKIFLREVEDLVFKSTTVEGSIYLTPACNSKAPATNFGANLTQFFNGNRNENRKNLKMKHNLS